MSYVHLPLPGLGSYLQTASNAGSIRSIVWGLSVMIGVIVLIDQIIWRPIIAWSEKFKFEQVEATQVPTSLVLNFLRRSKLLCRIARVSVAPARESLTLYFARGNVGLPSVRPRNLTQWTSRFLAVLATAGIMYAMGKMGVMLTLLTRPELRAILSGAGATFLRVELTLVIAALWTIPVGVFIGLRPRFSAIAQPAAQIAASVPAPALFPIVLLLLIHVGGGVGIASIVLLLLGTQWYILFNVIAGASAIPSDLKEVCDTFHLGKIQRWRTLILPDQS
jgi:NitT/TauT family transport system permease protein